MWELKRQLENDLGYSSICVENDALRSGFDIFQISD